MILTLRGDTSVMKLLKKVLAGILIIVGIPIVAFLIMATYLTILEYKPDDVEAIEPVHNDRLLTETDDIYTLLSWNIGYGSLDADDDFFMDGGKEVNSNTPEEVDHNIEEIKETINKISPDFVYLQEVDRNSDRSHRRDEAKAITSDMNDVSSSFAYNYKVAFVPYPVPPIGRVEAGLLTCSRYNIDSATRISLPNSFGWPVNLGNLKRCLLVSRIPVEGTGKEIVFVNFHLEAYDSGEGKIAQTTILKSFLDNEVQNGNYIIAGGDFNQVFSNIDISEYPVYEGCWTPGIIDEEDFNENFELYMSTDLPSCRSLDRPYKGADPSTFQYYVIDGFMVSKNITVSDVRTIDTGFEYSDHNPVILMFRLD